MKSTWMVVTAMGALLASAPVQAQSRWSIEFRGNGALPTQDIGNDELSTGVGLEANVRYNFLPHTAVYAGWDYTHFSADQSFAGPELDFEETGYVFGLRFEHPLRGEIGGPAVWARAGGTVNHVEVENDEGDLITDSDHGLGWEAGAGLALPIGSGWSLTPGARFRSLSRELEHNTTTTDVKLQYVAFEVGFAKRF